MKAECVGRSLRWHRSVQVLFIDPQECIDCDACAPECHVEAIDYDDNVPEACKEYVALNQEMAAICPPVVEQAATS